MEFRFVPFKDDFSNAPKWRVDFRYYEGDIVMYEKEVYEVLKNLTSEDNSPPNKSDDYLRMEVSKTKEVS